MQQQLQNFINAHNGQYLNYADSVPNQCVSVANAWSASLGFGVFSGNAIDIINQVGTHYTRINNTPAGVPSEGDIVVWGANINAGTTADGHVGIFQAGNTTTLTVFNQNAPVGSPCHSQSWRSYDGVIGWLHPIMSTPTPTPSGGAGVYPVTTTVNVRTAPHVTAPIVAQLYPGTVQITGTVTGDMGNVNGKTSNQWGITLSGHYFNMAATQ